LISLALPVALESGSGKRSRGGPRSGVSVGMDARMLFEGKWDPRDVRRAQGRAVLCSPYCFRYWWNLFIKVARQCLWCDRYDFMSLLARVERRRRLGDMVWEGGRGEDVNSSK